MKTPTNLRLPTWLLLLPLLLLFSGCPYQSTVPVAATKDNITDYRAHGKWICMEDNYDLDSVLIELTDPNSKTLNITTWDGLTSNKYNGWLTKIGKWTDDTGELDLLYVEVKKDGKTTYAIYKFGFSGQMGAIYEANPEVFKTLSYTTTDELRQQILRIHKEKNQNAFGKGIMWAKKSK